MYQCSVFVFTTGVIVNVLKDATKLQNVYQTLMSDQSQSSIWINQAMDSVSEILFKVVN